MRELIGILSDIVKANLDLSQHSVRTDAKPDIVLTLKTKAAESGEVK